MISGSRTGRGAALLTATILATATSFVVLGGAAGAVDVSTEAELRTAFNADAEVTLLNDITLTDCEAGDVDRSSAVGPLTFDGRGFTVTQTCEARVFGIDNDADATFRNVTVTGGNTNSDGGGIAMDDGTLTIIDSQLIGNCAGNGGGVESEDVIIRGSTFANNTAAGDGGAFTTDDEFVATAVNSTFTGNISRDTGALDGDGPGAALTLVYVTVVGNVFDDGLADCIEEQVPAVAPLVAEAAEDESDPPDSDAANDGEAGVSAFPAANVTVVADEGATLAAFGTVIAQPQGGENCELNNPTQSAGYNFSDDDSCELTNVATGDRENAGSPGLGALADNGGPTLTMLPSATSPLLNFIPVVACGGGDVLAGFAVTTDQRGITRPQDVGCEIGSVEVLFEVIVRFTG